MSNMERDPGELLVEGGPSAQVSVPVVLAPRDVPLGGPRAMRVRRTLPSRARTMIGAWCFLDHYGPERVAESGGMRVPPHPHTGLQTVSWLFEGEVEHRDSVGSHAVIEPGAVNLMTAGSGISHSETSTLTVDVLHGVQLWVALPDADRFVSPFFEHAVVSPVQLGEALVRVFVGSLPALPTTAAVTTFTPLVAAQLDLPPSSELRLDVETGYEHGVLVDSGSATIEGTVVQRFELVYLASGRAEMLITTGDEPARLLLIGGEPLHEQIVMWWNFVGRSHEEIVRFRSEWQEQIARPADDPPIGFGPLAAQAYDGPALPAPELPTVRLRPRE